MLCGGWTEYTAIDKDSQEVFEQAMQSLIGVSYKPFAVSSQVVCGTNFSFLCNAVTADLHATEFAAQISIYRPNPDSSQKITYVVREIRRIRKWRYGEDDGKKAACCE